nr:hypothetical protein [Tanacetum cinerariifolium]
MENEKNKRLMESVRAADYLSSIITNMTSSSQASEINAANEALTILYHLKLSQMGLKSLFGKSTDFVETLTHVMQCAASYESRTYAVMLLKSMFEVSEPMQMKSAKAGAVPVLVDTLLVTAEKRVSEMVIIVLDQLCQSTEGRYELLKHSDGLAVISKKIFRVSTTASERVIRILYSVALFSSHTKILQDMLNLGVVEILVLVLQVDCGTKMKEKSREILKIHSRA